MDYVFITMKRYPTLIRTVFDIYKEKPSSVKYLKYMAFQAIPNKLEYSNWFQGNSIVFPDEEDSEKYIRIANRELIFGKLVLKEFKHDNIGKIIAEYGSVEAYYYHINNYDMLGFNTVEWYCTNLFIRANKLDKDNWSDLWYKLSRQTRNALKAEDFD